MVLNCEYILYALNAHIEIRYNPFLSHWVEAIQRLELDSQTSKASSSALGLSRVRVVLIKIMLSSSNLPAIEQESPVDLFKCDWKAEGFDLDYFIKILEDEGIYERSQNHHVTQSQQDSTQLESGGELPNPILNKTPESGYSSKKSITESLQENPENGYQLLTHLPLDLPSLDFLTTMLQDQLYYALNVDPVSVIRDYIQHSLRTIERMDNYDPINNPSPSAPDFGEATSEEQRGREAQIRAVKLLVLFLRNLVRKALVPPDELYYEIQEVCVRYMWIKEVRDFRSFMSGEDQH
jgi:hypothetical protein